MALTLWRRTRKARSPGRLEDCDQNPWRQPGALKGSVPRRGETALHVAALHGRNSIVELLLEQKADIEGKNNYGRGARERAAGRGCGRLFGREEK